MLNFITGLHLFPVSDGISVMVEFIKTQTRDNCSSGIYSYTCSPTVPYMDTLRCSRSCRESSTQLKKTSPVSKYVVRQTPDKYLPIWCSMSNDRRWRKHTRAWQKPWMCWFFQSHIELVVLATYQQSLTYSGAGLVRNPLEFFFFVIGKALIL